MITFFFKVYENRRGNRLDFWDYVVRTFSHYGLPELVPVKHTEHMRPISHMHGRSIGILIAGHYFHTHPLKLYCHFLT